MANLRDLRRRRKSVANTKKITRTMELVASAKLKKAQDAAASSRPYADALRELVAKLSAAGGVDAGHPLMVKRPAKKVLILVATSDRGLAGAFNANLVNKAVERGEEHVKAGRSVEYIALGKKAASGLAFNGTPVTATHTKIMDAPKYAQAQKIADEMIERFLAAGVDLVEVVYARFVSAARQVPDHLALLPAGAGEAAAPKAAVGKGWIKDFQFHPNAGELLAQLIPQMVKTALYSALLQTSAAEHAARRAAMKNATDAASDMLKALNTAYNRGRQGKITQEIAEIVGAVEAMA